MGSNQKRPKSLFPLTKSTQFFQGPPFKRWPSDPTFQRARKPSEMEIAEIEQKTRTNFPELFYLRDRETHCTERCAIQLIARPYSCDISYKVQHEILVAAQSILEKCCYEFARQWFPSMLQNAGWDCAEAVELTKWTQIIMKHSQRLPSHAFEAGMTLSGDLLTFVHLLRHTAVHRLRTTARGVSQLIQYALKFTKTLKDSSRKLQLEELHREVEAKIEEMEYAECALDGGTTAMLQNELDGVVPQRNRCSFEEEITALFEELPVKFESKQQQECYSSDDDESTNSAEPNGEDEASEIIESVESQFPGVMRAKVGYLLKPRRVEFKRSRAPSPESVTERSEE